MDFNFYSNLKKTLFISAIALSNYAIADSSMFQNTNPYKNYSYTPPTERILNWEKSYPSEAVQAHTNQALQQTSNIPVASIQFSNSIESPTKYLNKGVYANLINNPATSNGCWDAAAKKYSLDPWLLMAIAKVESNFNSNSINVNSNKSLDVGIMQINSFWFPTLQRYGIAKESLFNPCVSIFVGAWILAQNIRQFGYNIDGIGAYNSPRNVNIRRNYALKVYKSYNELTSKYYYKK